MWVQKPVNEKQAEILQKETNLTPLTSRLLVSRGIETTEHARAFLRPDFFKELHNPFSLKGIMKVLERINEAMIKNERILFLGDYDADGVTTTAIFVKGFEELGVKIDYFVPNRFKDGYGVNIKNVESFSEYDLIITGDTGIKAYDAIYELATTYQTDVIVTDHHEPYILPISEKGRMPENVQLIESEDEVMALPVCFEVINPKRIDCEYPSKDLSGAGVAFKVMEALFDHLGKPKKPLYNLLDLVATGLIPDLVPLFDVKRNTFEVRNLVKLGLNIMNNNPKLWVSGVQELKQKPGKKPRKITSTDLGFTYGPILNACGRLYDPRPAAEYLLEEEKEQSKELITYLNEVNLERRRISNDTSVAMIKELKNSSKEEVDYGIVVHSPDIHVGITGLVAGNVLNEYYRTTIALAEIEDDKGSKIYKGSARSIDGISVLEALMDVEKEIGNYIYGGHEQAAGLTLTSEQLEPFKKHFRLACKKQADAYGDESVFNPKKYYDLKVDFMDVTKDFIFELNQFEPFGMGNNEPLFYSEEVEIVSIKPLGDEGQYLKFEFKHKGVKISGIIFSKSKEIQENYGLAMKNIGVAMCNILFFPQINSYDNKPQLLIKDIKINLSR